MPEFLTMSPHDLRPNPWNTNVVSPENEAKIDESLTQFGMFKPIIVRELEDGSLQILGGAHRRDSAIRLKMDEVPVANLGIISDDEAKKIGLIDNGRYGDDDTLALAKLLEGLGAPEDLSSFLPYSVNEFESIFSQTSIALDDLDDLDMDGAAAPSHVDPTPKASQTHTIMRFKVPVEDVAKITEKVNRTMKAQRFHDEDSLTNAGNALVHIFNDVEV
jgi:ParB family chromosome partitioning protein